MQKVSVVTMTYNDCVHLKGTIDRILKQDYENLEYIIVDGGSTDGTLELIRETEKILGPKLKWVSEPDDGLFDALNKGIRMATGDIIGLMCDMFVHDHVISQMVETIEREHTDGVHSDMNYVLGDKIIRKWRMGKIDIRYGGMLGHPTMFLKREVYETYGLYKPDYRIAADYEFMIRILKNHSVKLSYIPEVLVNMYYGEQSTSTGGFKNYIDSFKEGTRALKENDMRHIWFINLCRTTRVLFQFVR
jgi:glycosyltransferase